MLMMTLIVQMENVSDNWKYRRFYLMIEREEEDIFSQVFTMIHIKSFVQNIQTKTEMEPHDQF